MENKWNFKIDLKNTDVFDKLKTHYGIDIPNELKSFIVEANASYPEKNLIMINGVERVFEAVLSYNEDETEAVSVFDLIKNDEFKNTIPFGLDPFGNIFCYSLKENKVYFYDHEESNFEETNYSLPQFILCLF